VSRLTYKQAVENLETSLEAARLANEQVRAAFAALGGAGPVPDLTFKPLLSGMLDAWRQRVAEAEAFLNG